jgi:hypothetical protein
MQDFFPLKTVITSLYFEPPACKQVFNSLKWCHFANMAGQYSILDQNYDIMNTYKFSEKSLRQLTTVFSRNFKLADTHSVTGL